MDCNGVTHRIARTRDGRVDAVDHVVEHERVLETLGGPPPPCIERVRAWQSADGLWALERMGLDDSEGQRMIRKAQRELRRRLRGPAALRARTNLLLVELGPEMLDQLALDKVPEAVAQWSTFDRGQRVRFRKAILAVLQRIHYPTRVALTLCAPGVSRRVDTDTGIVTARVGLDWALRPETLAAIEARRAASRA